LIWDDYCGWFLEIIKPGYQQPIDQVTYDKTIEILENNLKVLHPFMPFISEEIWQYIKERDAKDALVIAKYPDTSTYNNETIDAFEHISEVVTAIRNIRKEKNIPFKDAIDVHYINNENIDKQWNSVICKLANVLEVHTTNENIANSVSFRVNSNEYFVPVGNAINVEEEVAKIKAEIAYQQGFLKTVYGKLHNEKFMSSAPEKVVINEKQKEADALSKIAALEQSLKNLG
jgi:valyl-tRNA synthetase